MSTGLIPQTPKLDSYATGLVSFAPSSRAVARVTRRRTNAVLGRTEVTHARDQARAVLAAGALNNTAAQAPGKPLQARGPCAPRNSLRCGEWQAPASAGPVLA